MGHSNSKSEQAYYAHSLSEPLHSPDKTILTPEATDMKLQPFFFESEILAMPTLIDALPPELLCHVFSDFSDQGNGVLDVPRLITLTHVCQRWRDVLLGCPSMWSTIDFNLPKSIDVCLARANDVPLSLQGRISRKLAADFPNIILDHMSHTRHISVSFGSDDFDTFVPILEAPSAPILESLTLRANAVLPEGLFSGFMPQLRQLELVACTISWTSSLLHTASIARLTLLGVNRPNRAVFIQVLKDLPNLTSLYISYSLPAPPAPAASDSTVYLDKLQEFRIIDEHRRVKSLFDSVFFRRTVVLTMTCDSLDDDISSLIDPFSHFITPSDPIRSLYLQHSATTLIVRGTDQELHDMPSTTWATTACLSTRYSTFVGNWSSSADSIAAFATRLPLSRITSLCCKSFTSDRDPSWDRIFPHMPGLRYLVLEEAIVSSFIDFVRQVSQNKVSSLRVLRIFRNCLGRDNVCVFEKLADFLLEYTGAAFTLRKLSVETPTTDIGVVLEQLARAIPGQFFGDEYEMGIVWL